MGKYQTYLKRGGGGRTTSLVYGADVLAYQAAVIAAGSTVSGATLSALQRLQDRLTTAGVWTLLEEIYPFGGDTLGGALVKFKFNATAGPSLSNTLFVGGDFSERGATGGLLGNGSTKRLATLMPQNLIGATGHVGIWLQTRVDTSGAHVWAGAANATDEYWLGSTNAASNVGARWGGAAVAAFAVPGSTGWWLGQRLSAVSLLITLAGITAGSSASSVTAVSTTEGFSLWALSTLGVQTQFSADRLSFGTLGAMLSFSQGVSLSAAITDFQRDMGRA